MTKNSFVAEVTFKRQSLKMVKPTQIIRQQIVDEMFECV